MMSLQAIKDMAREAAIEAAEEGKAPHVYYNQDDIYEFRGFPFPFLGDFVPEGWELVDTHFVDSSGLGAPDEPALTADQFIEVIKEKMAEHPGVGWGVIQAGQFQVYVGEFHRVGS